MNMHEVKSCLNGIQQLLMQDDYDEALTLLSNLVCHAVRNGYKQATGDWAVWKDGEQFVGVQQNPLSDVLLRIDHSTVSVSDVDTLLYWNQ